MAPNLKRKNLLLAFHIDKSFKVHFLNERCMCASIKSTDWWGGSFLEDSWAVFENLPLPFDQVSLLLGS